MTGSGGFTNPKYPTWRLRKRHDKGYATGTRYLVLKDRFTPVLIWSKPTDHRH